MEEGQTINIIPKGKGRTQGETTVYKTLHGKKRSLNRYQMGNQNPQIEEEQTIQWPREKVQKDKQ
jgi:hypothetical protein